MAAGEYRAFAGKPHISDGWFAHYRFRRKRTKRRRYGRRTRGLDRGGTKDQERIQVHHHLSAPEHAAVDSQESGCEHISWRCRQRARHDGVLSIAVSPRTLRERCGRRLNIAFSGADIADVNPAVFGGGLHHRLTRSQTKVPAFIIPGPLRFLAHL